MEFAEFKEEFIIETSENIEKLEEILLTLEDKPSEDSLKEIYRIFHTIKGSAGFLELDNISECAHSGENLLDFIIKNKVNLNEDIVSFLFKITDFFKDVLTALQNNQDISQLSPEELISKSKEILQKIDSNMSSENNNVKSNAIILNCEVDPDFSMKGMKAYLLYNKLSKKFEVVSINPPLGVVNSDNFDGKFSITVKFQKEDDIENITKMAKSVSAVSLKSFDLQQTEDKVINEKINKESVAESIGKKTDEVEQNTDKEPKANINTGKSLDLQFIKIPISRLDNLLNLVGELVITNSAFYTIGTEIHDKYRLKDLYANIRDRIQELERISHDLQENIMKIRMLPLRNLFFRYKRFIHDYASETNKKIELIIKGEETELDKKIMDIISEPLTHLIRNAVDHGIESVEERKRKGKPEVGKLEIDAFQESNFIIISIKDDGAGIDVEKIKNKAIEKGIITAEKAASMNEEQLLNLIFEPGFSTSEKVSKISGRGIGMDIVKKTLTDIQGILEIHTVKDKGTQFLIKIPITLAIINAILVMVNNEKYAIPMSSVVETIKINGDDIISVDWQEAIKLRNTILPLLRLETVLTKQALNTGEYNERELEGKIPVVVVNYMNKNVGLVVDKLLGKQEIVIKSLTNNYKNLRGIAGASILGDGTVSLIIDARDMIDIVKEKMNKLPPEKRIKLPDLKREISEDAFDINKILDKINRFRKNMSNKDLDSILKFLPPVKLPESEMKKLNRIIEQSNKNAVKSFNAMVPEEINIKSPNIRVLKYSVFKKLLNELKNNFVFVVTGLVDALEGSFIFALTRDNALKISNILLSANNMQVLTEEHKSALKEITNIIASSYTNALTANTNYKVSPTVPQIYTDGIKDFRVIGELDDNAAIIIVENTFVWKDNEIMGFIFLNLNKKNLKI